jgi:hypothetical protein
MRQIPRTSTTQGIHVFLRAFAYALWGCSENKPALYRLAKMRGSGRELWKDESADQYVERLRGGWP